MHCSKEGKAIVTFMPGKPDFEAEDTLYIDTGDTDENSGGIESVEAMLIKYVSAMGRMPSLVVVRDLGHFVLSKADNQKSGRLAGRISIVTGGAQGFGRGIAEAMAAEGALTVIADLNPDGAKRCADELNDIYGSNTAIAVAVDVSDEYSVERMVQDTVLAFGGLDVLVSNAGVLIAGSVSDMTKEHFDFVTRVNYTGYFLCAKYAAQPMKIQNEISPGYLTDIIEINSKSGLEGSNKNFAYAGSKFGGIGLTQSFAMELLEFGIKVNAICPGNLLDGPLWSDPEKGLFKQYLDSGKVEGAKTISDVRRFYENKVPMGRGCTTEDVARAIFYVIEQKYETGQAIPVTGGQVMLK
jgi:NAD(P)-dependent dehydrogenase (short-subunit alcohol dehydrogenase family)